MSCKCMDAKVTLVCINYYCFFFMELPWEKIAVTES